MSSNFLNKVFQSINYKVKLLRQSPCYFYGNNSDTFTILITVPKHFNINTPYATQCIRIGLGRGFEENGINWALIPINKLENQLHHINKPIIYLIENDYTTKYMTKSLIKKLRNIPHFVWGGPDYDKYYPIYNKLNIKSDLYVPENIAEFIAESHPNFIQMPAPESAKSFYTNFSKLDIPVESIPLACDTKKYFPVNEAPIIEPNQLFFCGGYWPKKAIQFDHYLKPYEEILVVYGYSKWPYSGYKGLLSEGKEKILYKQAALSPALSEPHAQYTGDIVERVFKVLGSGGCAITDVNPFYKELFQPEELPVPKTIDEYHQMVHELLKNKKLNETYRQKGYNAVMKRHTYKHRAEKILRLLRIKHAF